MGIVRKEFHYKSADKIHDLYGCIWQEETRNSFRGIVQLAHGMAEHVLRYEEFACFLARHGFLVCGNDHLGHGRSVLRREQLGYFGEAAGSYRFLVQDVIGLTEFMQLRYGKEPPYFLMGHSMGSFLVREVMVKKTGYAGVILLGTSGGHPFLDMGIRLCEREIERKGGLTRGISVNRLAFKPLNLHFHPVKTEFDWISSKRAVVDRFMKDERCGFLFTYAGYRELFLLLREISSQKWAEGVPKELPVLLASGAEDPVGDFGRGIHRVAKWLTDAGCNEVSVKLFEKSRHEILNEENDTQVYRFLLRWLNETAERKQHAR